MQAFLFPSCITILNVSSLTESLSCSLLLVFRCEALCVHLQQWAFIDGFVSTKHDSCNEKLFLP